MHPRQARPDPTSPHDDDQIFDGKRPLPMREEDLRLRRIEHTAKRGARTAAGTALSHVFHDTDDLCLANIARPRFRRCPTGRSEVLRGECPIDDYRLR